MNRRKFISKATRITTTALVAGSLPSPLMAFSPPSKPDLVVWKGKDHLNGVKEAIEEAGGIQRYIPKHATIGVLVNSRFDFRAALVNPDVTLGLLELLSETKPKEIVFLQLVDDTYWDFGTNKSLFGKYANLITQVQSNAFPSTFNEEDFVVVEEIKGAKFVKNAEVVKRFLEVDVFVNVPLIKHHATTHLTGALKNLMGITTRKTNVGFHLDSGVKNDPGYLGQCIADINLFRKPDLVVADATELIITNGPSGPGEVIKPDTIIVGKDPVAIDAYGCKIMDFAPEDLPTITCAYESGVGEMDLEKLYVKETGI